MRQESRELEFTDLPSIRLKEGRYILGLGETVWREQWLTVFQYKVTHWKTGLCTLLNLESLVEAVYPAAEKNKALRVQIAHDYMWRVIQERRRDRERRKSVKDNDGEGTK